MIVKQIIGILIMGLTFITCQKGKKEIVLYKGNDISQEATIKKDLSTKTLILDIKSAGKWDLYAGVDIDNIDFSKPIIEGNDSGSYPIKTENNTYNLFSLETKEGTALLGERHLSMEGGYNFRDLGGIKTTDGRFVKWSKLFRADKLGNLTNDDLEYLGSIPIISVIDFRSKLEAEKNPDRFPYSVKNKFYLPINPGNLSMGNMDVLKDPNFSAEDFMQNLNIQLINDSSAIEQYRKFFEILQSPESAPLIFHCTAGKDRTGMGAALILYSLGVDEELIMENYLESNKFLYEKYNSIINENRSLESLMTVKREYLESGINLIKREYSSIDKYLTEVLQVDINRMKELYLY